MAYDKGLAQRIEEALDETKGIEVKQLFGGVGYMLYGNMAIGIGDGGLIVRVGPEGHDEAMSHPHVGTFGPTGRTMKGWVTVSPEAITEDDALRVWVQKGVAFASSLPPK